MKTTKIKYRSLTEELKLFVSSRFEGTELPFHNLNHTLKIRSDALKLAGHDQLSPGDLFLLEAACLMTDLKYIDKSAPGMPSSALLAEDLLIKSGIPETLISGIRQLVQKETVGELGHLNQIYLDAIHAYEGKKSFFQKNELLKNETEMLCQKKIPLAQWRAETIGALESYQFQTPQAIKCFGKAKEANLKKLRVDSTLSKTAEVDQEHNGKTIRKADRPEKGIETMFRITSSNNQHLSNMADNKAHILITVNSIILSAIISLALRKLDLNYFLAFPTFFLLGISVISLVISILATRPAVPEGKFTIEELKNNNVNLLFFGNYYKMMLQEYKAGMFMVMENYDSLYTMLIMDVYYQGAVLGKKYKLLKYAYNVFMYGLTFSVVLFVIVTLINHYSTHAALPALK